jgi:hypothetical protein
VGKYSYTQSIVALGRERGYELRETDDRLMHFLGAALFALAIMFFLADPQGFLRVALGLLGIGIVIIVVGFIAIMNANERAAERRQAAAKLIRLEQLVFSDEKLTIGPSGEITGVVSNRSLHSLSELYVKVVVTDCETVLVATSPASPTCSIVGETTVAVDAIDVPPGQKRAFRAKVSFANMPKMGNWHWNYSVPAIVAKY